MDRFSALDPWREIVTQSFQEFAATLGVFLPKLLGALAILLAGWAVAWALERLVTRTLRLLGLDRATSHRRLASRLERAGIATAPSVILGRLVFWLVLVAFLVPALRTLSVTSVDEILERLLSLLPSIFAAGLVLLLGLLLARFVGGVVSSVAAAADVPQAPRLGLAAEWVVALLVVFMALQQLGVDARLVVMAVTVLIAAVALTVGATFSLAARPIVTHILAGHFLRQSLLPEMTVVVGGRRGVVERVGATDTLLRDGEKSWSMPNGRLLEETIDR